MRRERITTYEQLDNVIVDVLKKQKQPISAKKIEGIILQNFDSRRIKTNPRSLSHKLRRHPNIRVIQNKRQNLYSFF